MFSNLFNNQYLSDVLIKIEDKEIYAHKLVLCLQW